MARPPLGSHNRNRTVKRFGKLDWTLLVVGTIAVIVVICYELRVIGDACESPRLS